MEGLVGIIRGLVGIMHSLVGKIISLVGITTFWTLLTLCSCLLKNY
jgi:hypothetical protein